MAHEVINPSGIFTSRNAQPLMVSQSISTTAAAANLCFSWARAHRVLGKASQLPNGLLVESTVQNLGACGRVVMG